MDKLRIGIYGATGNVGWEAIESLLNHPWFEISRLFASGRSAGKKYKDACPLNTSSFPDEISDIVVEEADFERVPKDIDIAFLSLREDIAKEYELKYAAKFAKHATVVTTSSALRMDKKIPLVITEVNFEHLKLAEDYRREFGSKGVPFPQSNCTAVPVAICLKPLIDTIGVEKVYVDSYQSISGSGANALMKWKNERLREDGLPEPFLSTDMISIDMNFNPAVVYDGNIRPIGFEDSNEEQSKVYQEILKIFGKYTKEGTIIPANFGIDCMFDRTPTYIGHYEHIRIKPAKSCTVDEVKIIYEEFNTRCRKLFGNLPSSPERTIVVLDRYPQPRFDVDIGNGMSTVVGGIEIDDGLIKLRALSNNLKKGSAKGSVQLMEYLYSNGFI